MRGLARTALVAMLLAAPVVSALAAEKEDPFKYRNLPIEASCLDGYHPTVDADGNNVFPCIANAENVAPGPGGPTAQPAPKGAKSK